MSFSIINFTLLDWLAVAIVLYSIVMSAMRGFVREVLGIATVLTALLVAGFLHDDLALLFKDVVRTENLALFLGFSLLFVTILTAGFVAIWFVYRIFEVARIEWFDRLLGGAFGFVRGWLIAAVIFMGLTSFGVQADVVRRSQLSPYFLAGSRAVAALTPFELKARFLIGYEEVQRWWSENL